MRSQQKFDRTFKKKFLNSRFFLHIIIKIIKKIRLRKIRLLIQHTLKSIYDFFQNE